MPSFDVVSELDMHEVSNAVDQCNREIQNRYDFKKVDAPTVKCLHLQVGSWLGLGEHPGEAWLKRIFPVLSCSSEICGKKI